MLSAALLQGTSLLLPTVVIDSANSALPDWLSFTRASPAWRFNANGLLEQVGNDVIRRDWDPETGALRGYLVEESRTNLLTRSEEFDHADWFKGGGITLTANAGVAPDGNTTAERAEFDGSFNQLISQPFTAVADTQYTMSVWLRLVSGTPSADDKVRVGMFNNLVSNVANPIGADLTSSWQRFTVTGTADADGGQVTASVRCDEAVTLEIWGAQVEAGAFETSYIKTEDATVIREADVATTSDVSWFEDGEGTFLVESSVPVTRSTPGERFIAVNDGTLTKSIVLDYATQKSRAIVQGGTNSFNQSTPDNFVAGVVRKSALSYAANDIVFAVDGAIIATSSTVIPPTGLTQLQIGSDAGGVAGLKSGHIRRIAYWPHRLPVAALRRLSRSAA